MHYAFVNELQMLTLLLAVRNPESMSQTVQTCQSIVRDWKEKSPKTPKKRNNFFEIVSSAALAFLILLQHFVLLFRHQVREDRDVSVVLRAFDSAIL